MTEPEWRQDPSGSGQPEESPERGTATFVRVGLYFYGAMIAAALIWRVGLYGEPIVFSGPEAEAAGLRPLRDGALGVAIGLAVVAASHVMTSFTRWGETLARQLGEALGPISVPDAVLLAIASGLGEELFFRGALQPRVGLVLASILFGLVHFVPRREMLPWTGFAIVMGFLLGAVFEWTGNLVAPGGRARRRQRHQPAVPHPPLRWRRLISPARVRRPRSRPRRRAAAPRPARWRGRATGRP